MQAMEDRRLTANVVPSAFILPLRYHRLSSTYTPHIRQDKRDLRLNMRARRAAISAADAATAAKHLATQFLASFTSPQHCVLSSYFPTGDELDTQPLMQALHAQGRKLVLPVIVNAHAPLQFRCYQPGQNLTLNSFGIYEPDATAEQYEPDILLTPLLAFDRQRRRLGYGGGYYDRTLDELMRHKTIVSIGIAYACQEVPAVPTGRYDIPLTHVATDQFFF